MYLKIIFTIFFCSLAFVSLCQNVEKSVKTAPKLGQFERIEIQSRIPSLNLSILHLAPQGTPLNKAVLFIHGASFPSALSFGFRMDHYSWMDDLSLAGYDVYALDYLGYGGSGRYPEMWDDSPRGKPLGRAVAIQKDVDHAVNYVLNQTGFDKLTLIAHSWGGLVASLYASKHNAKLNNLVLFSGITEGRDTPDNTPVEVSYFSLTPNQRVSAMDALVPEGEETQLAPEVFSKWKKRWLQSDPIVAEKNLSEVRFPSGPAADFDALTQGKQLFDPSKITVPVLIVRGKWDQYPDDEDARTLLKSLTGASTKKYVVIDSGTHVMHLEKVRYKLYDVVREFLKN